MTTKSITIKDVGPIADLRILLPEGGGVVELRGRNGSGKSTAIEAADALLRGNGRLSQRRDAALAGEVEGLGARIKVGRQQRRTGEPEELQALALETDLDPSQLVDPGLKDPAAADARRIKALMRLGRVQASPEDFAELVGGLDELSRLVPLTQLDSSDPLVLAEVIKKALEAQARQREGHVDTLAGQIEALRALNEGVDLDAPADKDALAAALDAATRELAAAEQWAKDAAAACERSKKAHATLAGLPPAPDLHSLSQVLVNAQEREVEIGKWVQLSRDALLAAQEELAEHEGAHVGAVADRKAAEVAMQSAQDQIATRSAAQRALDEASGGATGPGPEQMQILTETKAAALQAVEGGAAIRQAKERAATIEQRKAERMASERAGERLRDAARATEDVLSSMVQRVGIPELRVRAGRLMLLRDGTETPVSELSHGERWRLWLPACITAVGKGGLLCIPQEGWEAEDPANKAYIAEAAREAGVVVLTARATDGELRAEPYAPTNGHPGYDANGSPVL